MTGPTTPGKGESVISRVVRIFDTFTADAPVLSVSEIARRAGLHVATASRLVEELVSQGLLQREADRRVRVGVRMWELASRASPTQQLREVALPVMELLQATVGQHTQLGVLDGDEVIFVERLRAPNAVVNFTRVAGRLQLHASSSGVVLLAHSPPEFQERVLSAPLKAFTADTITDPGQLRGFLDDVRRQGFALCRGFIHPEAAGLAAPLRDRDNTVVAALSVIVPNDEHARDHLPPLLASARAISRALGAPQRSLTE